MKNKRIKELLDETFSDLKLFYRDVDLLDGLIEKYKAGQILKEKGFVDMTSKSGGSLGNLRYVIASSDAKDLSKFNPDSAKIGHYLLDEISFFKVLDVYKLNTITQVFLLHIPDNSIQLFKNSTLNLEEEIVEKARKRFHEKKDFPLLSDLQTPYWKDKTKAPIGMSFLGEWYFDDATIALESPKRITIDKDKKTISINKKPWWKLW